MCVNCFRVNFCGNGNNASLSDKTGARSGN